MSTSPDFFARHQPLATAHTTAPNDPASHGYSKPVDTGRRGVERRRRPQPRSPRDYLEALPALMLLDRLPMPMLASGFDGVIVYTNPAFAGMLGYPADTADLAGQQLSALLARHSSTSPRACVGALRAATNLVVDWLHVEGFPVRSVVSETLFFRASDRALLIGITDISELTWAAPPEER